MHNATARVIDLNAQAEELEPVMTPIKLSEVLKSVPTGQWAALSKRQDRVLATGGTLHEALESARRTGVKDPIVVKVSRSRLIA